MLDERVKSGIKGGLIGLLVGLVIATILWQMNNLFIGMSNDHVMGSKYKPFESFLNKVLYVVPWTILYRYWKGYKDVPSRYDRF